MIIGHQDWEDLLFTHHPVPADALRPLVPERLSIDEREGSAWVSTAAFTLRRGSVRGLPPLPDFLELNLRTYVTHPQRGPGIWFFSLDAASTAAVIIARLATRLPYFRASMDREGLGAGWYRSQRRHADAAFEARWEATGDERVSAPGSLEEFLVERYALYSRIAGQLLLRGPVRHEKWPLRAARVVEWRETLSRAAGFAMGPPALAHWTRGVSVDFEPLLPC